ncbi:uncharacterized protein N7484_005315 [Penicillium longicatenatum]|uniref:uncharacterized protein n=1 Tax=Penicillium longicatenatum TaxID=1561947 RepID=UPI0025484BD4|nr:uncharacterized protein N7484_005315 [Penicillium longicatenatum]KAJ5651592.1 hypothetical protein N7484_005315 [Penicillium longicatenatum]
MAHQVWTSLSVEMTNMENWTEPIAVTIECTGRNMTYEGFSSRRGDNDRRKGPGSMCDDLGSWSLNPLSVTVGTQANQLGTQTLICTATSIASISMTIDSA